MYGVAYSDYVLTSFTLPGLKIIEELSIFALCSPPSANNISFGTEITFHANYVLDYGTVFTLGRQLTMRRHVLNYSRILIPTKFFLL